MIDPSYQGEGGCERYLKVCDGCPVDACNESIYIKDLRDITCSSALEHTTSLSGATVETLQIEDGYWRATNTSKTVLQCYNAAACRGGQTGDANFCEGGYTGPCEEAFGPPVSLHPIR